MVEVKLRDIVGWSAVTGFAALIAFGLGGYCGWWGSRRDVTDYSFQYRGKPAAVMHKDIIGGTDIPYISLEEGERIYDGSVISDDGKLISVNNKGYSTKDSQ